jgi:hypothetical protein
MNKEWKAIPNTQYLVSSDGDIFSKKSGLTLVATVSNAGYLRVTLYIDGEKTNKIVHRLVAKAFCAGDHTLQVNHIDGNKLNNSAANLEWVTSKENHQHAIATGLMPLGSLRPGAKLSEEDVLEIKQFMLQGFDDGEISELMGTVTATISKIRHGNRWTHVLPGVEMPDKSSGTKNNARGKSKLAGEDIPKIRQLYADKVSLAEIGRIFKVHSGTIDAIVKGKTWTNY